MAAATVGALTSDLARDDLAVIAFWSDAALLAQLGARLEPGGVVDSLVAVPTEGLTNIAFPLETAAAQLRTAPDHVQPAVLLSDCVHNAGPNPRPCAARLARLDVLLDLTGERDADPARDLAYEGRGRVFPVRTYRDVAPALTEIFVR